MKKRGSMPGAGFSVADLIGPPAQALAALAPPPTGIQTGGVPAKVVLQLSADPTTGVLGGTVAGLSGQRALAISADSWIDAVHVYPGGDRSPANRRKVTRRAPLVAYGQGFAFDDALIELPRYAPTVAVGMSLLSGEPSVTRLATVTLDVIGGSEAPPELGPRAPLDFGPANLDAASPAGSVYVPVFGRGSISVVVDGIESTSTVSLYAVRFSGAASATEELIATGTDASPIVYAYSGPPWDYLRIVSDTPGSEFFASVVAHDGGL